jgi:AcrR family transcriptional regulator
VSPTRMHLASSARRGSGHAGAKTILRAVGCATAELAQEYTYDQLDRRLVADRAGLSYLEVCAHFGSIEALIAHTCLDRLHQSPIVVEFDHSPRERLVAQFHQIITLLACQPRYGIACVRALMSNVESVRPVKADIDAEVRRHVSAALGFGAWPELVSILQMALLGAVVQAATNTATLPVLSRRLGDLVEMVLPGDECHHDPRGSQA